MSKKTNRSFFAKNYLLSWDFIKETKNLIFISIGVFVLFSLIGFFTSPPEIVEQRIIDFIRELLLTTQGMSHWELIGFILFNNIQASFFGIILGIFLGIFPIISSILNGYLVGYVSSVAVSEAGISSLLNLVPHGIFELPALFISLGMGIKLGLFIFQKDKKESLKSYLKESLRVFVFVVIPLLIIAALIEGSLIFISR